MMRSSARLLLVLVLASAPGAVLAAERQQTVPARFHGEWNENLKHCGTSLNDSRLIIGPEQIRFHESAGAIKAVVTQGETDLALIAELSGEGETWLTYNHFRLSADQKSLTDVTDGGEDGGFVRYRCPKGAK
jgi:hypothetical protein